MKTLATLFTGGGGFEAGAVQAGFTPIWGVECDPDIAQVYARNFGPHVIVSTVEEVDYSTLQTPYHLHASPSCKKASIANKERGESIEDINAAEGTARAIRTLLPPNFSLENVWGYREFESFKVILRALKESGYAFDFWHLNSADFGVPQTRKRLILIASRTHKPRRPQRTHAEHPSAQIGMFSSPLLKSNGWYKAIEDLIPTLPESKFAAWQLKRLPIERVGAFLATVGGEDSDYLTEGQPSPVISAAHGAAKYRAFIVEGTAAGEDNKFNLPVRESQSPIFTVRGSNPRSPSRLQWLIAPPARGSHGGRVVSMTPRALARFQSIPDSFVLPEKNGLACRVIGNAVPSLLGQRIIESVEAAEELAA